MADTQTPDQKPWSAAWPFFAGTNPFLSLNEDMDRMLHAFSLPWMTWDDALARAGGFGLRIDIAETDKEIEIKADLPGIAEEDVEITLKDGLLHLRADKKQASDAEEQNWKVVERAHGVFERTIRVPSGINADDAKASFDKGVLTVTLPKPPEPHSHRKRIAVTPAK